jgi:raffinose/stachyose/melibiose transport system permease protein
MAAIIGRGKVAKTLRPVGASKKRGSSPYPLWFLIPGAVIYLILFIFPTVSSLFFSLTRWTLFDWQFIGLDNYFLFFSEPFLVQGLVNTFFYAFFTSGTKVVLGMLLALWLTGRIFGQGYLRAVIFFPVLVSTIGIGITFKVLMQPFDGLINTSLTIFGIEGPMWLTDPSLALFSIALIDVWKGVGIATVIYIAGLAAIPQEYNEAATVDGASGFKRFKEITFPLLMPATSTVIILSLIGGLRSFDLIWAMTKGGPGFASDVMASIIFKQYQAGFYGLSTAGNVVLFIMVAVIIYPLSRYLNKKQVEL